MQDHQPEPPRRSFLGTSATPEDLVPPVDPAHLKKAFEYCRDVQAQSPGQLIAISGLEYLLPDGADAEAVGKRAGMLTLLLHVVREYMEKANANPLAPLIRHQQPDDAMFSVMARIRLERMERGFIYNDWPYDVEDFIRQVEQEAA
jgi:hypothetical protein